MSKKHGKNKGKGVRSGNSVQPPSRPSSGPVSARDSQPVSVVGEQKPRESQPQAAPTSTPTMRPSMTSVKPGIGFVFDVPSEPRTEPKQEASVSPISRDSSDASEAIAEALSKDDDPKAESATAHCEETSESNSVKTAEEKPSAEEEAKDENEQAKSEASGQNDESKEIEPAAKPANKDESEQPRAETKNKSLKAKKASQEQSRESKSEVSGLHDDVHDEFFRKGEEVEKEHIAAHSKSLPPSPVEFNFEDDHAHQPRVLTPERISHQKRLRRIFMYVLGASIALAAVGLVKVMSGAGQTPINEKSAMAALPTATTPKTDPDPLKTAPVETAIPAPSAAPAASIAPAASGEPAASASASVEAVASAAPAVSVAIPDGVDPKKEALRLLERSKFKDAIPMAEAAIAKDPTDAYGYLYLGTALQSSGKWKEGIAAYSRCVHTATKGPVVECRQSGGR